MNWKISPADRKVIRAYAATAAGLRPLQIGLMIAQRCNTVHAVHPSVNVRLVDRTPEWSQSDLYDKWMLHETKAVPLDENGEAEIDLYVYSMEGFGAERDIDQLETTVQAHVKLVDGKPRIWKMTENMTRRPLILI